MQRYIRVVFLTAIALVVAGCGEVISATERIDRCLKKQPDATHSECKQWEKDGELQDNGAHKGHENM